MPLPFGTQLSVELTNIGPVTQTLSAAARSVYETARALRKSGSDLLVEEDLAAIFGRGKIESNLHKHFKDVVKLGSLVPLHSASKIMLDSQPGPTTRRALKDEYYMSTVIQLSLLSWFHERTTLASALAECMDQRFAMKLPQSNPDANYEGIHGTLTAVCSEISMFPWALYVGLVEAKLPESLSQTTQPWANSGQSQLRSLESSLLLACMDYLYILQSLPEDRIMQVEYYSGMMPLVIWAHFILGLTVTIQGSPDGTVKFGHASTSNVIINWLQPGEYDTSESVSLLDNSMDVILHSGRDEMLATITAEERIPLEGYGTTFLRRHCNRSTMVSDDSQGYSDFVAFVCALTIRMSLALYRFPHSVSMSAGLLAGSHFPDSVEQWRIFGATRILFRGIDFDESVVNRWLGKMMGFNSKTWLNGVPIAMRTLLSGPQTDEPHVIPRRLLIPFPILILAFSHVSEVEACAALPLVYGFHSTMFQEPIYKAFDSWDWKSPIQIAEDDWFILVCTILVGLRIRDEPRATWERAFLISDYGWSVFFGNVGDLDPTGLDLGIMCIKRGIPFNPRTNERKQRILDALHIVDDQPPNAIVHGSASFVPRCVYKIMETKEYFSSRRQEFWRTCRYDISDNPSENKGPTNKFSLHYGYRHLHRALWGTMQTDPCEHWEQELENVDLAMDTVAVKGFSWAGFTAGKSPRKQHNWDQDGEDLNERICILLVKGNRHARWLALGSVLGSSHLQSPKRQVLLRTEHCCVNCAMKAVSQLPNKWLIIL